MKKLKITEMERLTTEAFRRETKLPIVVVLDDVRSMNNVGSVFRTADAFRLEGLVLCGITARPPHPDIHKTALGAEDSVAWTYAADSVEAVEEGEEGILIVKIDGSDLDIGSAETVYLIDETMDASGYSCAQTQIGPDTR